MTCPTLPTLEGIPPVRFRASWVAFALVALALAGLGLAIVGGTPTMPEPVAPTLPQTGVTPIPRGDLPIIGDPIRDLTVWYSNRVSDANRASLDNLKGRFLSPLDPLADSSTKDLYGKMLVIAIPLLTFGGLALGYLIMVSRTTGESAYTARSVTPRFVAGATLSILGIFLVSVLAQFVTAIDMAMVGVSIPDNAVGAPDAWPASGGVFQVLQNGGFDPHISEGPDNWNDGAWLSAGLLAAILLTFVQMINGMLSVLESLLVIIGPLCLAAYALPATERVTNLWLKLLTAIFVVRFAWTIAFILFSLEALPHIGPTGNPPTVGDKATESTGTTQTLVVDGTTPTISFAFPAAGGPVLVPSASAAVTFTATDAVAGFGGSDDWDLQRQVSTWSGSACGTFANDTGTKALVSNTTNLANQISSQGLQVGKCYRWTLTARDQNGNTASAITSGSIRTDTSGVLGDQSQFGMESWDLGTGDNFAVSTGSGNLRLTHPLVSLPIVGGALDLSASYNSQDTASMGMGPGWRLNVQRRLTVNADGSVTFTDSDGSRNTFTSPTGSPTVTYTRPATLYATLTRDTAASPDRFTLTYRDQSVDIFDEDITNSGLLKQIKDRNGNTTSIAYSAGTAKISTITDPASRVINFTWTGSNLTSIVDWANVSSGIVQTTGSGNRTHRFFYDGSNNLIGWADPINTAGSCPTGGSHMTCLTNTGGFLTAIAKTQTYETFSAGTLGSAARSVTTSISYEFADVIGVTDAEAAATTFTHPAAGETKVVRPGTPASETTYALVSATDAYGRVDSVKRKLGAAQIETETTYNATYPTEPATLKQDKGGAFERVTNFTYLASSLGLVSRLDEPLDGTYRRYTDLTYNSNSDLTKKDVSSTDAATDHTETRYCYTSSGCSTSATDLLLRSTIENYVDGTAGGASGQVEDVTTAYTYDGSGQRVRQTRSNYSGSTLLDSAATGWTYDANGNLTSEIRNYANGTVTNPGDDISPHGTTNARTDLTTAYTYDTAGNRVSSADPRRAIETALGTSLGADDYLSRNIFDALNQTVTTRLPTTTGITDCGSPPGCRESTTTYDELGLVREAADINGLVTATKYDKAGRALETYEDPAAAAAATTSVSTYDAQGRLLTAKDQRQVASASLGSTGYDYDELGRVTDVTEADGSSPDVSSITHTTYDNLDRKATEETGYGTGTGQVTTWTSDIAGRTTRVDDEFTCASTTYDYRDLALTVIEGQTSGTCTGSGLRTITNTYDGRGRVINTEITAGQGDNDILAAPAYDAVGSQLSTSATTGGVSTSSSFTYNLLDQQTSEVRLEAGTPISWIKVNADAAGNQTDRCVWNTSPGTEWCKAVGQSFTTNPAVHATSTYDASNRRISLAIPSVGETTYSAADNYQVSGIYVPTASGKELQSLYSYDNLHRLIGITHQLCAISSGHSCSGSPTSTGSDAYTYDDNDNRTRVNEDNGNAGLDRYYCYDALNRVVSTRSASGCSTGLVESYTYDDPGNRTAAGSSTFTYDAQGQLSSCSPACGTIAYDTTGRTSQWNGWYLTYDGEGRLASACKVSGCATGDMVTMRYDAQGHRVELVTRPNGGATTTTTFRYQGDAIAQELVGGTVTRTYVTDDAGAIVKFCDPDCTGSNPQYLVTWNGHGDAASAWKIDTSTGVLTLANSYTYTTWGQPTTATHNSIADLGFRFLYVGRFGVAWDNAFGLGLEYMSARHYSPALGRFLQPDPTAQDVNLYAYAESNPITKNDPDGTCPWCIAIAVGIALFGGLGAATGTVNYAVMTPIQQWRLGDAGSAAWRGATNSVGVASFLFPGPTIARFGFSRLLRLSGFKWNSHIFEHGASFRGILRVLISGQRFHYLHKGTCKVGFYLASTNLFVATSKQGLIFTAFFPDNPTNYIRNLKANPC